MLLDQHSLQTVLAVLLGGLTITTLITLGSTNELGRYGRWYWAVVSVILPGAGPLAWFLRLGQLRHRHRARH